MSFDAELDKFIKEDYKVSSITKEMEAEEPILQEDPTRYVLFPIKYHDVWRMYKTAQASFWTAEEIDLAGDIRDYNALTDGERHFIHHILAFFSASDGIVIENLATRFIKDCQPAEIRAFYAMQVLIETIHSETYSLLLDTYVKDPEEKHKLFNAIETIPAVGRKAAWAVRYIEGDAPFAQRLLCWAIVEGLFFSGAFCSIFWLKKRGKMPGLTFSNELISRDEGLHTEFACMLYRELKHKLTQEEVYKIIHEALLIEEDFVCVSLPVELLSMNSKSMVQYIKFVADRLLVSLGYEKLYNSTNPFDFMDMIGMQGKTNFFERRVGDYQKAGVLAKQNVTGDDILHDDSAFQGNIDF